MGTRVLGLGLESDSSPDLVGLGLESHTLGLGLDSRHAVVVVVVVQNTCYSAPSEE